MQIPIISRRGQNKPWTSRPRIDKGHPLARGLSFYCLFDGGIKQVDLVRGRWSSVPVLSGGHAPSLNAYGYGLRQSWPVASGTNKAAVQWTDGPMTWTSDGAGGGDFTIATGSILNATGTPNASSDWIFQDDSTSVGTGIDSVIDNPSGVVHPDFWTWNVTIGSGGTFSLGAFSTIALTRSGSTGRGYFNGASVASNTTTDIVANSSSITNIGIACSPGGQSTSSSLDFTGMWAGAWDRSLSAIEMQQIHLDPYCFLIFPEDEIFATLIGVGGVVDILAAQIWL